MRYELPDGRVLLDDVSFRVGEGAKVALVGANGAGKTTLLRIVTGELKPHTGAVTRSGGLGVMRQMVGQGLRTAPGEEPTVADLLLSVSPPRVRSATAEVDRCERMLMETDDEKTQLRYAAALSDYADAGGYDLEVTWDVCSIKALGVPFDRAKYRELRTLSGGEQKRLVLEFLLAGPDEVLLLDEPDNFLDVPGKIWLEQRIRESDKTILFISHDRELLNNTATRVVTVELGAAGNRVWTHPGGFASYHEARRARFARFEELRKRWDEEHAKLRAQMLMYKQKAAYNSDMANGLDLGKPGPRDLDRRDQVRLAERLHHVRHRPRLPSPVHQVALAEGGQHHHRGDPSRRDLLRSTDAVELWHLDVHHDEVRLVLLGERDSRLAIPRLADDLVALLGQHLHEIEPDQYFVLGHHHPGGRRTGRLHSVIGHASQRSERVLRLYG